jgi:hypothetical protein
LIPGSHAPARSRRTTIWRDAASPRAPLRITKPCCWLRPICRPLEPGRLPRPPGGRVRPFLHLLKLRLWGPTWPHVWGLCALFKGHFHWVSGGSSAGRCLAYHPRANGLANLWRRAPPTTPPPPHAVSSRARHSGAAGMPVVTRLFTNSYGSLRANNRRGARRHGEEIQSSCRIARRQLLAGGLCRHRHPLIRLPPPQHSKESNERFRRNRPRHPHRAPQARRSRHRGEDFAGHGKKVPGSASFRSTVVRLNAGARAAAYRAERKAAAVVSASAADGM